MACLARLVTPLVIGNDWRSLPPPRIPPAVSVVVAYYDQQDDLDRLLAALAHQVGPVSIVDVVVADDGSPRPPVVPATVGSAEVRIASQPDRGFRPAAARNGAVTRTGGDVLVFLDADTSPGFGTVAQLAAVPAVAPDAVVVGRRHHCELTPFTPDELVEWLAASGGSPPPGTSGADWYRDPSWLRDLYRRSDDLSTLDDRSYHGIIGAVMATSRSFFDELGGFDATIVGYGGEDWDLAYRAYCAGALLAHERKAATYHNGPDWAERTAGCVPKNDERLALHRRIPGPGDPIVGPFSQHLVTLAATDWPHDATIAVVAAILRAHPTTVRLAIESDDPGVVRAVEFDSRVVCGDHPGPAVGRSLTQTTLYRPVALGPKGLGPVLDRLGPGRAGQIDLLADDRRVGTATSTRALARARRWASPKGDPAATTQLIDELFGCAEVPLDSVGAELLVPPVDLEPFFPR